MIPAAAHAAGYRFVLYQSFIVADGDAPFYVCDVYQRVPGSDRWRKLEPSTGRSAEIAASRVAARWFEGKL